jgi:peptidoglycan/LPS O-acetylase OafA/YrhL
VWKVENAYPGFFGKAFIPNGRDFTRWQWMGNLTLTETWRWHIVRGTESELIAPSWTLCYEEQFYVLTGITLIFARRFFFGALGLITVLVAVGLLALPINTVGLFLDGKWLMFAAGILVYYTLNYVPRQSIGWFCIPLGLGILWSLIQPEHLLMPQVNELNQSYLCAFSFALILIATRRWDYHLSRARITRPLAYCGEMCYSVYLIHWPTATVVSWGFRRLGLQDPYLILVLGVSCCLIVVLVLARAFHTLVERRFWNRGYFNSTSMETQPMSGLFPPQRVPDRL